MNNNENFKVVSDGNEQLIVENAQGKQRIYYRNPMRTMFFRIDQLSLSYFGNSEFPNESRSEEPPSLMMHIEGIASIENGNIAVIGDQSSETHKIELDLGNWRDTNREEFKGLALKDDTGPTYADVALGFSRADREVRSNSQWTLRLRVLPSVLATIAKTVSDGTLLSIRIGVSLRQIYTNDGLADLEPPCEKTNWFLRPNAKDHTIKYPESAYGTVSVIRIQTSEKIDLSSKIDSVDSGLERDSKTSSPASVSSTTDADELSKNVRALHITIKIVGCMIVGSLLILAFK